jgi:predicted nucleic acid-binding protein
MKIIRDLIYLTDTNVLLRYVRAVDPLHGVVAGAVRKLRSQGHALRTTSQNLVEFWNVATRPAARNGLGLTPAVAFKELRTAERFFPILEDSPKVYPQWRRLVAVHGVSGVKVHDARLVAFMLVHGVGLILTFNGTDFGRYSPEGVAAVDPLTV